MAGDQFAFYAYVRQWPEVIEDVVKAEDNLRRIGRDNAADLLLRAYGRLKVDLVSLGRDVSISGTATLRDIEKRTRVRPDSGGRGGPRLEDKLVVRPLASGLIPGAIGIADLELLDTLGGWWELNELGGPGRANNPKPLFGYFFGGGGSESAPDASQFREHALFTPGSSGDPVSGIGIVRRPMPARRFIEKSIAPIDREWRAGFTRAAGEFSRRLEEIAKTFD